MAVVHRAFAASLLLAWQLASAVSPKELAQWFASPAGLSMSPSIAQTLADQTWNTLTMCEVSIAKLQLLKNTMAGDLSLDIESIRKEILPLAEAHISPGNLTRMNVALSSSYTLSGGLGFPQGEAARRAIPMSKSKVQVNELYDLYKVMFGYFGLGFDQDKARNLTIQQASAGADAATFKDQYQKAISSGATDPAATDVAVRESVNNYLAGMPQRYARDTKKYSSMDFQQHFGPTKWLDEWLASPMELRVSADLKEHTPGWFYLCYGDQWKFQYMAAAEAIQERLSDDGKVYGIQDFQRYHGDDWQTHWASAPEVPCTICGPFTHQIGATTAEIVV